ncbi:MAG: hypothetical protein ACI9U0_002337, partial [Flavobacteriales bacterium]
RDSNQRIIGRFVGVFPHFLNLKNFGRDYFSYALRCFLCTTIPLYVILWSVISKARY